MNNKKLLVGCLALLMGVVSQTIFADAGDWIIRARAIDIDPDYDSGDATLTDIATGTETKLDDSEVSVDNQYTLDIDITYMITKHIGLELLLDLSSTHDVYAKGNALKALVGGGEKLLSAQVLPPTLFLQYHILPDGKFFRPYIGIGLNYTVFFDEKLTNTAKTRLGATSLDMDSSFGVAGQVGFDFDIGHDIFLNLDVKYIDIDSEATFKAFGETVDVDYDVSIDPWVFGIGIGKRF